MAKPRSSRFFGGLSPLLILALPPLLAFSAPLLAEPPPWAPAYGHHKYKHKDKNRHRDDDYNLLPWLAGAAAGGYLQGNRCNREAIGTVLGAVIGGVAGSQIGKGDGRKAATIAGTLIGVLVGKSIGRSMDQADQYCTGQTLEYAKDGQAVQWRNPDTQAEYRVTPTHTYESRDGRYCREYINEATIGGQQQQTYGTACRQPDGSWQIVN